MGQIVEIVVVKLELELGHNLLHKFVDVLGWECFPDSAHHLERVQRNFYDVKELTKKTAERLEGEIVFSEVFKLH